MATTPAKARIWPTVLISPADHRRRETLEIGAHRQHGLQQPVAGDDKDRAEQDDGDCPV